MLKLYFRFLYVLLALSFCTVAAAAQKKPVVKTPADKKPSAAQTKTAAKPEAKSETKLEASELFAQADAKTMAAQCVTFETAQGKIELEFFPESAPESVRNFLNLSAGGYFDGTVFSRVVPGFIIQGGDLSTGKNWTAETAKRAAKTVIDEPSAIKHERGIVSLARHDEPNTATTHFFILLRASNSLDGSFAAFGRVRNGMEIVEAINEMPVEGEKPVNPVKINKAKVAACSAPAADQ